MGNKKGPVFLDLKPTTVNISGSRIDRGRTRIIHIEESFFNRMGWSTGDEVFLEITDTHIPYGDETTDSPLNRNEIKITRVNDMSFEEKAFFGLVDMTNRCLECGHQWTDCCDQCGFKWVTRDDNEWADQVDGLGDTIYEP